MTQFNPDKIAIWAKLLGVWTDISSSLYGSITGSWGISGDTPISRIADSGMMQFQVNNVTGNYAPNMTNKRNRGWGVGTEIKLVITSLGEDYIKFYGKISDFSIDSNSNIKTVGVVVTDWLDYAAKYHLPSHIVDTDQRGDQVIDTILAGMPIEPAMTTFDEGDNIFPYSFPSVDSTTRAYTEMSRICLSEVGYLYLTKHRFTGENLVFESASHRNGLTPLDSIPVSLVSLGHLTDENGDDITDENGDPILISEAQYFHCTDQFEDISENFGKTIVNQFRIKAYPKRIDTSPQILFSLDTPLLIPSGSTVTFTGNFRDPSGGSPINGINLIAPVSTTDFLANTKADSTGTNTTANIMVSASYGSQTVDYTITNSYSRAVYLTKLQSRGYGIYPYNTIEAIIESQPSIDDYGYKTITLEQQYQSTLTNGYVAGQKFLNDGKEVKPSLEKISMVANISEQMMNAYLFIDVGSKIWLTESETGIDGYFYVQSVDFEITGKIIRFTWKLARSLSLQNGLESAEIYTAPGSSDAINFGYLPKISNLMQRTYTCWFKLDSLTASNERRLIGIDSDYAGTILYPTRNSQKIGVYTRNNSWPGKWETAAIILAPDVWYFAAMSRDISTDVYADPIIYFDGVSQAFTEVEAPNGGYRDETGSPFLLGNAKTNTIDYIYPLGGSLKDARVYNRILSASEILDLFNGTDITDGLVFQGPCTKQEDHVIYDGQILTDEMKILDNIYGSVGTPHGSPTCNF